MEITVTIKLYCDKCAREHNLPATNKKVGTVCEYCGIWQLCNIVGGLKEKVAKK